jgi:hypothetical protein
MREPLKMSSNPRNDVHNKELGTEGRLGGIVKQHDRSWPALVAFFAVTTLAVSLLFAAVLAGVTVAIAGGGPAQISDDQQIDPAAMPSQAFSGIVTDARCGPRHKDSQRTASDCARMCERNGSTYVIVDGDRNYELAGNPRQLDQWAGQRVTFRGILEGNTIKVNAESLGPVSAR